MAQRIVGLDLGTYSVKVVQLEGRGRTADFEVLGFDEEEVPPASTGAGDPLPLAERHEVALRALEERGSLKGDVFVTGLPGDAAAVRTLAFPYSDPRKIEQTLPFELEAEIPFDIEDVVISWAILGQRETEEGEVTEVLCAYARREALEDHLELLGRVGVDPRHVEFDSLALDDLFDGVFADFDTLNLTASRTPGGTFIESGPDAPEPAIAMVDIGHRRTSVSILADGRVVSAQTILHGGADATRQLSRELGLPLDEAERGKKKEAFIEVLGAKAQFSEQERVSNILKQAFSPVARRLRQIFQASLSAHRVRVVRVILTGGGSRVLNLDRHLSEVLNVKVQRAPEVAQLLGGAVRLDAEASSLEDREVPQAALALAYALSGVAGDKTRARIDFRTGEYAWKGELDFIRERAASLGIWAAVLLLTLGISGAAQAWVLSSQEDELRERQITACESITGQRIESSSRCLAIIQERIGGQSGVNVPEFSAVDTYLEVSKRLPPQGTMDRKVTELDVNPERARMKATVADYDAVDKVVAGLNGGRCFDAVEKGKAKSGRDGVEFDVVIRLDCEKSPGDEAARAPEPASTKKASSSSTRRSAAQQRAKAARERAAMRPKNPAAAAKADIAAKRNASTPSLADQEKRKERLRRLREKKDALRRAREGGGNGSPGATLRPRPFGEALAPVGRGSPGARLKGRRDIGDVPSGKTEPTNTPDNGGE
jgi:general secretion pathway protein L